MDQDEATRWIRDYLRQLNCVVIRTPTTSDRLEYDLNQTAFGVRWTLPSPIEANK